MSKNKVTFEQKPAFSDDCRAIVFELLSNDYENTTVKQPINDGMQHFYPKSYLTRRPHLSYVVTDELGKVKTKRFINGCNSIDREEQIKLGYDKNFEPTRVESDKLRFHNGFCVVTDQNVLNFLWESPQHLLYKGNRDNTTEVLYRLQEKGLEATSTAVLLNLTNKALTVVGNLLDVDNDYANVNKDAIQNILFTLYGAHYVIPENPADIYNNFGAELGLATDKDDDIFKVIFAQKDNKLTEQIDVSISLNILLGKAIEEKIISFDIEPNNVHLKIGKNYQVCYNCATNTSTNEELKNFFIEYLKTEDGVKLVKTIEKNLKSIK